MANKTPTKAEEVLDLDYTKKEDIWLTSQNTLRRLIGIFGLMLPFLLWIFVFIVSGRTEELPSISHYYYTRANGVFIIIISTLAIFLIIYKGKELLDFYLSSAAGLFALCLLLFPTSNLYEACGDLCAPDKRAFATTWIAAHKTREIFHYLSAAIFLGCLAAMSLFVFTKSDKSKAQRTEKKNWRNRIYIFCGIVMFLAMLVVFPGVLWIDEDFYDSHNLTFWMETVLLNSLELRGW